MRTAATTLKREGPGVQFGQFLLPMITNIVMERGMGISCSVKIAGGCRAVKCQKRGYSDVEVAGCTIMHFHTRRRHAIIHTVLATSVVTKQRTTRYFVPKVLRC